MSITQAADDLCLTQSAISKQIRSLEDILGVPLFRRGFRSVEFTEHGLLLFRAADGCVQQLQEVLSLFTAPRKRPVTITASTSVAGLWLLPRVGEFQALHPDIDVRFSATNAVVDLGQEVDLAIRYCSQKQAPLGAVKLFGETIAPVASPAHGIAALETVQTLKAITLLEFDVPGRPWLHWGDWLAARGWSTNSAKGVLHFNQYEQMIQAAVAGQGVALGRLELLQPMLHDGRLQMLRTQGHPGAESAFSFWLIQADSQPSEDVKHVVDWILGSAQHVGTSVQLD